MGAFGLAAAYRRGDSRPLLRGGTAAAAMQPPTAEEGIVWLPRSWKGLLRLPGGVDGCYAARAVEPADVFETSIL